MKVRLGIYVLTICIMFFVCGLPLKGEWKEYNCKYDLICEDASSEYDKAIGKYINPYTQPFCNYNSMNIDYADKCMWTLLTNKLSGINYKSKRDVIELYCNALLSSGQNNGRIFYSTPEIKGDTRDRALTFDSHQSLFVYTFCSSFKDAGGNNVFLKNGYDLSSLLKGDVVKILKLKQMSKKKDLCSLEDDVSLKDCDMSIYATEIFSAIMSDMFKIKYAQVFNVEGVKGFDKKEERIVDFMSGYFNITDNYKTIQSEFPQTVSVIDSNQKYYKKVLDTLVLINNESMVDIVQDEGCSDGSKLIGVNFLACAMHASQGNGLTIDPSFVTRFYNEILNYRIFIQYYKKWLEMNINMENVKKEKQILEAQLSDFDEYTTQQIFAATKTLHDIEELTVSYPLHIGLLLYQEKIKKFRDKKLSPIVTHFYSLSEKLKNVQVKDS